MNAFEQWWWGCSTTFFMTVLAGCVACFVSYGCGFDAYVTEYQSQREANVAGYKDCETHWKEYLAKENHAEFYLNEKNGEIEWHLLTR